MRKLLLLCAFGLVVLGAVAWMFRYKQPERCDPAGCVVYDRWKQEWLLMTPDTVLPWYGGKAVR